MKIYKAKLEIEAKVEAANKKDARKLLENAKLNYERWGADGTVKTKKHKIVCIDEVVASK